MCVFFDKSNPQDIYWRHIPNKSTPIQLMVYFIFALDVVQTFLITANAFYVFGEHFGDIAVSNAVGISWFAVQS